jgi:hypothetical protein
MLTKFEQNYRALYERTKLYRMFFGLLTVIQLIKLLSSHSSHTLSSWLLCLEPQNAIHAFIIYVPVYRYEDVIIPLNYAYVSHAATSN